MSVTNVMTRVSQIEAMIASAVAGNPNPAATASATSFNQQLTQASGPGASVTAAAATTPATTSGDGPFKAEIDAAAQKYGLDPALLRGLIRQESNFDPNAQSGAGAVGLCQLMPGTAAALGCQNPSDPAQSIDAGAHYLRQQLDSFGGDERKALAAYNAGPGAVQSYGGVPPYGETQNYVQKVLGYANEYRAQAGASAPSPFQGAATTAGAMPSYGGA